MTELSSSGRESRPGPRPRPTTVTGADPTLLERVRMIWLYRDLLLNLTRKELKVTYKNSVLGFVWSLLNPLMYLVIFSIVFQEILRAQVPRYAIYLLSGLIAWNLFSASVAAASGAVVGNSTLVQKVWFPREVLPLAAVGAALWHFMLQLGVLCTALLVFRHDPAWHMVPILLLALAVLIVLTSGVSIAVSALNVRYRDTGHLLDLTLLAWFWMTPIVYEYLPISDRLGDNSWIAFINPVLPVVMVFQETLYNPEAGIALPEENTWWFLRNLGVVAVVAVAVLFAGLRIFAALDPDLAEDV